MTNIPLSERKNWIGSSESAVVMGLSPYNTLFTLWHQKAGNIPVDDLDGQERIMAGKHLEPAIAAWAAEKWTDWTPRNVESYLRHPSVSGMGASLDFEDAGFADGEDHSGCPPIEVKNVDWMIFKDEWESEGDEILNAPAHYLIQLQHQLACRPAAPYGWLLACVGGNRLYRMRLARHPGIITRIETEVSAFWDSVRTGREPPPNFEADGRTISRLHCVGNGEWLDLTDNNRLPDLCATYRAAKAQEKDAKGEADAALAEIRSIIGDAAGADCQGFQIKVSDIKEGEVNAFTREAYRRFSIKEITNG